MNCPRCNGEQIDAYPTNALLGAYEYQLTCRACKAMWSAIWGGGRIRPTPAAEAARDKEWANVTFPKEYES